jgi:single-strand DNA-binding protein
MLNKVMIIGNLGNDPEIKVLSSGTSIANTSIATTRRWKDRQSGERKEETEWHRVTFYGALADIVGQYLRKGSQVYVEGRIKTRKWQGQDGQDRYTTEIIAENMTMLGGKGDGQAQPKPQQQTQSSPPDFDDDIPF